MSQLNEAKEQDSFITTREAALLLGVSLRTIQLWVESGVIKAWKTAGGHRRIPRSAVAKLLEQRRADIQGKLLPERLKILLVEDEPELMEFYRIHITSWGLDCRILTAKNGFEGLLEIGQHNPDFIISDLLMPDMDGFHMIRSLQNRQETKGTLIIAVTSLSSEQIEKEGGLPDDVLVLRKPVPLDVVKELVTTRIASNQTG